MQLYPMLRIALFLVVGIVLGHEIGYVDSVSWLIIFSVLVVLSAFLFKFPIIQTFLLCLSVTAMGALLVSRQELKLSPSFDGEEQEYSAVLVSQPEERGKIIRCDLRIVDGPNEGCLVKASILKDTVMHHYKSLTIGDGIMATSVLEAPYQFASSKFNYPLYLKSHGFSAITFIYWNAWIKERVSMQPMSMIERTRLQALMFRYRILSKFNNLELDERGVAILSAMTLGEKSGLDSEVKEIYSSTGASHVLALSGLHLGIIYGILSVLFYFRRFRLLKEILILVLVWTYVFVVGLSPSVTRAATMVTIYSFVGLLNRDKFSLNTLGLTAIIMLLINPLILYDVGFELSFMAVFFILLLYRPVYALIPSSFLAKHRIIKWFCALMVISFTAQLGTAPLVAYYFGRLPVYFFLTNLVVIPLAIIVLYGFAVWMLLWFVPSIQVVIAKILTSLLSFQTDVLSWIAALPGARIEMLNVSRLQVCLIYFLIMSTCFIIWKLRKASFSHVV